jgi:hypothetical protein
MTSRSLWVGLVVAGMLAVGCGGKKEEPPPPAGGPTFVVKDGKLLVRVPRADGSVFFVEAGDVYLRTKDGVTAKQPPGCPTCEGCDCRKPACNPFCM